MSDASNEFIDEVKIEIYPPFRCCFAPSFPLIICVSDSSSLPVPWKGGQK